MKTQPASTDFSVLIEHPEYIDNTLLIDALETSAYRSNPIYMPSGSFKTSVLSMLRHFYDVRLNAGPLFVNKSVWNKPDTMQHQGQYTVIHLDFSDVKGESWETMSALIKSKISDLFKFYQSLLIDSLKSFNAKLYKKICDKQSRNEELKSSLRYLTEYLYKKTRRQIVLLIDNIDDPLIEAKVNGYYNECYQFFHDLYSVVSHNLPPQIRRAVLMGKCHFGFYHYSDIPYSSLHNKALSPYFGLTESHVTALLKRHNIDPTVANTLADAYGGHQSRHTTLHHPASVWAAVDAIKQGNPILPIADTLPSHVKSLLNQLLAYNEIPSSLLTPLIDNKTPNLRTSFKTQIDFYKPLDAEQVFSLLIYLGLITVYIFKDHNDYDSSEDSIIIPNRSAFEFIKTQLLNNHEPVEFINHGRMLTEIFRDTFAMSQGYHDNALFRAFPTDNNPVIESRTNLPSALPEEEAESTAAETTKQYFSTMKK